MFMLKQELGRKAQVQNLVDALEGLSIAKVKTKLRRMTKNGHLKYDLPVSHLVF